jgi:hypothetical protein
MNAKGEVTTRRCAQLVWKELNPNEMAINDPPGFLMYQVRRNLVEEEVVTDDSLRSRRKTLKGWEPS